jgi:hypothetical protein
MGWSIEENLIYPGYVVLLRNIVLTTDQGVPHTPGFPVGADGFHELHAAFLNESRTRRHGQRRAQEIRGMGHPLIRGTTKSSGEVSSHLPGRTCGARVGRLRPAINGSVT